MADTHWCGADQKIYIQSGGFTGSNFSSTLKDSANSPNGAGTAEGQGWDGTDAPHSDRAGKLYVVSSSKTDITTTVKTSRDVSGVDAQPRGISWDDTHSPWCGRTDVKLYTQSGQFASQLKDSVSVSGVDATVNGISFDNTNTPWAGQADDKLYLQSGGSTNYGSVLKDSQATPDSIIKDITWDGTDSGCCTNTSDKLFRLSGQFTGTVKTSVDVTSVDAQPLGIEATDNTNRLGLGGGGGWVMGSLAAGGGLAGHGGLAGIGGGLAG